MWNRKSIVSIILLPIAFYLTQLIYVALSGLSEESGREISNSVIGFIILSILPFILYVVVIIYAFFAIKDVTRRGEKGLFLPILAIIISCGIIFIYTNSTLQTVSTYKQETGNTLPEFVEEGGNLGIAQARGIEAAQLSSSAFLQTFVELYKEKKGNYPIDREEIDKSYGTIWSNSNKIRWEYLEYSQINNGQSYIIRTQLKTNYLNSLSKQELDGVISSVNCEDDELYYCLGPKNSM